MIVVTGSASGIGAAVRARLEAAGQRVLGVDLRDADVRVPVKDMGVPADWHPHGTRAQILADLRLTAQDVARDVTGWISGLDAAPVDPATNGARAQS